ncbi:MAG: type II toxin-antitoxin system RelE/ParE family toxin [Candidatus Poribacteria bacterium]|nr:type II toxin-antitoxin system RelE/ParE family toxin [Candidatus Poribacteria bacterium]
MRDTHPRNIQYYRNRNGRAPFIEWLESIYDSRTQSRIERRLDRLRGGNFGEYKSIGDGVFEMILDFGPGYRIYFGEINNTNVLLLYGGDKSSQNRDIQRAKMYWREYKETNP